MENRQLADVINNEYRDFALYTVENRAIPSCIDGLKPVQRKILYSMINEHHGKKVKIAELGSIAKLNYHHGEMSAMAAAIGMTAGYQNNVPLFKSDGNFGTRLIQEASAPRYIYAMQAEEFKKFFTDQEVVDRNKDLDNPEPQTYLPLIPWVLVNGVSGIAVGFASKIMSHDPRDLIKATLAVLKGKKQPALIPKFPDFKGEVEVNAHDKFTIKGIVTRIKRNVWEITEVPYGMDRAAVYDHLVELEEKNKIESFEDGCDKSGFKFTVKLNSVMDADCSKDPVGFFKLYKKVTENYTTLDEAGNLKIFEKKSEIVEYFTNYRLKKVREKIEYDTQIQKDKMRWLLMRLAFMAHICDNNINLRDKTKDDWVIFITDLLKDYKATQPEALKILNTPIVDFTEDNIERDKVRALECKQEIERLSNLDSKEHYIQQLELLLKQL